MRGDRLCAALSVIEEIKLRCFQFFQPVEPSAAVILQPRTAGLYSLHQTAEPDIFVGGDAYTGQKFAIDAIAAGKQGAVSLHRWVQHATLTIGRDKREFIELNKNDLLLDEASYDNTPRQDTFDLYIGIPFCTTRCAFDAIHLHRDLPECSTMRSAEDKMKGILPYMIKRKIRISRAKKAEKRNG